MPASTYCYGYAVAAALRYAGDHDIDVVNMSLFADPYLYYCGNDAGQRQSDAFHPVEQRCGTRGRLLFHEATGARSKLDTA